MSNKVLKLLDSYLESSLSDSYTVYKAPELISLLQGVLDAKKVKHNAYLAELQNDENSVDPTDYNYYAEILKYISTFKFNVNVVFVVEFFKSNKSTIAYVYVPSISSETKIQVTLNEATGEKIFSPVEVDVLILTDTVAHSHKKIVMTKDIIFDSVREADCNSSVTESTCLVCGEKIFDLVLTTLDCLDPSYFCKSCKAKYPDMHSKEKGTWYVIYKNNEFVVTQDKSVSDNEPTEEYEVFYKDDKVTLALVSDINAGADYTTVVRSFSSMGTAYYYKNLYESDLMSGQVMHKCVDCSQMLISKRSKSSKYTTLRCYACKKTHKKSKKKK